MCQTQKRLAGVVLAFVVLSMAFTASAQAEFGLVREYGPIMGGGGATGGPADLGAPHQFAYGPGGNVFVADTANDRVAVFDPNGNYVRQFGSSGSGQGQFQFPYGIAISGDSVFVSDYTRDCVLKFDSDGTFVTEWGKGGPPTCSGAHGSQTGEFNLPNDIEAAADGIYVNDYGNDRIQKFNFAGSYLGKVDDPDDAGTFGHVVDMAADGDNTLWATYSTAGTVGVLQMNQAGFANPVQNKTVLPEGYGDGQIADTIGGLDVVTYVDSNGNPTSGRDVYIVDLGSYRIQRFNAGLGFVSEWPTSEQDQFENQPFLVRMRGANSFDVLNGFRENYLSHWGEKSAPPEPVPPTPVGKAKINKVKVKGPAKVKRKKKTTYKVKISNSGDAAATSVRLKVKGRGVSFNTSVGKIGAKKTRTVKVRLKAKKLGKVKVTFKVTSGNAGGKTVKKTITVKK